MNFQIKNRFSGAALFGCELPAEVAGQEYGFQLGFAVKAALKAGTSLACAELTYASLACAELTHAELTHADLAHADLTYASLAHAELTHADLTYANLAYADLTYANLAHANLAHASLACADLTYANLAYASLACADLAYANIAYADLTDANIAGTSLAHANLATFKQDMIAEVLRLPNEMDALRAAIVAGQIDGSTYSGECACLAGTLAQARGLTDYRGDNIDVGNVVFHANSQSPRERWFAMIREGDTPKTNPASNLALEWLDEAIAIRDAIRGAK